MSRRKRGTLELADITSLPWTKLHEHMPNNIERSSSRNTKIALATDEEGLSLFDQFDRDGDGLLN
eukprot:SAG31_NODE_31998_length_361_cov_0.946565_1_plen_64_part_01